MILREIIKVLGEKNNIILVHANADADAIGSAIALKRAFPGNKIGALGGVSRLGKRLLEKLGESVDENPKLEAYARIIALDSSSPSQFGSLPADTSGIIVIDHHANTGDWKAETYLCDDKKTSCAEIVHAIIKRASVPVGGDMAFALLLGITTDTGQLFRANSSTLRATSSIIEESGIEISDVFAFLHEAENQADYSQKVANFKGIKRVKVENINGYLVAHSFVSSFESSLCNIMIQAGADVAMVFGGSRSETRVTTRASQKAVLAGLHLGKLSASIGKKIGCESGGGHPGAAGLCVPRASRNIVSISLRMLREEVSRIKPSDGPKGAIR